MSSIDLYVISIDNYRNNLFKKMPHMISNLYEKSYTPFTAKLAPKNLWQYPKLGK